MIEPLRVLHVVGSLGTGGIQSYLLSLYRNIDRRIVQFDFVVHIKTEQNYEKEVESLGGKIFYIDGDSFEKGKWKEYCEFWRNFFKDHEEYKIVHGHLRSTSAIYLFEAKKYGRFTIAHSHATSNGYGKSALIKNALQFPTRFIADYCMGCSEQANQWMFGRLISKSKRCCVIRNGIDITKYTFNSSIRERVRKDLCVSDNQFVIGTVGRLVEQKNHVLLIKAFAEAYRKRKDISLIIVGDGPIQARLKSMISELGIQDKVLLMGSRQDVNELLQAMDCFAMPSQNEGLGIAVIEAQAADLPVLVSPAITSEAIVSDRVIRLGYSIGDWSEQLMHMKQTSRLDRSDMIRESGYSIKDVAAHLVEFYINRFQNGECK